MLVLKYRKLWKPYAMSGCSLERAIDWLKTKSRASDEIIGSVIRTLFVELGSGRKFPTTGCDPSVCECGMKNAQTAIIHHLLREVNKLKSDMDMRYWQVLESMHRAEIEKYVELQNADYIKKSLAPWYRKGIINWICDLFRIK